LMNGEIMLRKKYAKAIAALSGVALASVLVASPPVSADKPGEPAESGVVERYDPARGGHVVGPVMTDVGGTPLPIVVVVGWDNAVTFCTGGPPVFNGVQQDVSSPSGNLSVVVHNSDVPVLVFDVSAAVSVPDFLAKCAAGEIVPMTGTAKQRPILNFTDSAANIKVKTRGVVTDANGQDWTLQAFTKVHEVFGAAEPQVLNEWVTLKAL
jgi:hypothetical protein